MKVLYKKDSKGKTRVLRIWTEGSEIVQESGLLHGKLVSNRSQCEGKNIGRSNETIPDEQAILEMESKITLKLREGYVDNLDEMQAADEILLPMLAQDYKKHDSKINWNLPVFTQPKFDGMRCFAVIRNGEATLWSRSGKQITTCNHIIDDLVGLEEQILDGELYRHGESFQENMRLIKKYRAGETEGISFHMYDMVHSRPFANRIAMIASLTESNDFRYIEHAHTQIITNEKEMKEMHKRYLADGYEGTIVRHGNIPYEVNKRSYSLLKYKDFIDEDYQIIDIVSSEKRPEQGVVVCFSKDGLNTFRANPKMSHQEREELLTNKANYIGKMANVRFFEYSDDGIPRFPVFIGVHQDR